MIRGKKTQSMSVYGALNLRNKSPTPFSAKDLEHQRFQNSRFRVRTQDLERQRFQKNPRFFVRKLRKHLGYAFAHSVPNGTQPIADIAAQDHAGYTSNDEPDTRSAEEHR